MNGHCSFFEIHCGGTNKFLLHLITNGGYTLWISLGRLMIKETQTSQLCWINLDELDYSSAFCQSFGQQPFTLGSNDANAHGSYRLGEIFTKPHRFWVGQTLNPGWL